MTIRQDTYQKIARANKRPPTKLRTMRMRPLTWHERIAVRSAAKAICKYGKGMEEGKGITDPMKEILVSCYTSALLTGLSIGTPDWWRDLPGVVVRYINRFGCEDILER
jgi:hypothetical protein